MNFDHNDSDTRWLTVPRIVPGFLMMDGGENNDKIVQVRCGPSHSIAITKSSKLYSWGEGIYGKLGTGYERFTNKFNNLDYPNQIL